MKTISASSPSSVWASPARSEVVCWAGGLLLTFGLFFAMAHFETVERGETLTEIEDVSATSILLEPPPPSPQTVEQTSPEELLPLTGIDAAPSDSPVKIAAVPPDVEALITDTSIPPTARVEIGRFHRDLKPAIDSRLEARRVYQQSEVDQRPRAIIRVAPPIARAMFGKATWLRVTLLLVIDTKGRVESTRIMASSGNAEFDALVAQTVKDQWIFSAAIKRGQAVRCLAQQPFRVTLPGGTPFSLE